MDETKIRAKFTVASVTLWGVGTQGSAKLMAVTADDVPENQRFHKYTPSGTIEISIDNPPALDFFKSRIGGKVYVDFTPAS